MKRRLSTLILTLVMAITLTTPGIAAETTDPNKARVQVTENGIIKFAEYSPDLKDTTNVKLDMLNVNVPYPAEDIEVKYIRDDYSITALILDKKTETELESYTEHFDELKNSNNKVSPAKATTQGTFWRTMSVNKSVTPGAVRVVARVRIWSEGSFRQINKVDYVDQMPGGGGPYTLENTRTGINSKLPTPNMSVNAIGNVVVKKSHGTTGKFSYNSLKGYGFSMSGTVNQNWYARKFYNLNVNFNLY